MLFQRVHAPFNRFQLLTYIHLPPYHGLDFLSISSMPLTAEDIQHIYRVLEVIERLGMSFIPLLHKNVNLL